jgi:hypothetical protein
MHVEVLPDDELEWVEPGGGGFVAQHHMNDELEADELPY